MKHLIPIWIYAWVTEFLNICIPKLLSKCRSYYSKLYPTAPRSESHGRMLWCGLRPAPVVVWDSLDLFGGGSARWLWTPRVGSPTFCCWDGHAYIYIHTLIAFAQSVLVRNITLKTKVPKTKCFKVFNLVEKKGWMLRVCYAHCLFIHMT